MKAFPAIILLCVLVGSCFGLDGDRAYRGEFPYHIAIHGTSSSTPTCSGALVEVEGTQVIVTSGLCVWGLSSEVSRNNTRLIGGQLHVTDVIKQTRQVGGFFMHENYNVSQRFSPNSIGLIIPDEPFNPTNYVAPIPLPSQSQPSANESEVLQVTGYGYASLTDIMLKKRNVFTVSKADCEKVYSEHGFELPSTGIVCVNPDYVICPWSHNSDSGVPVRRQRENQLAGVVSQHRCEFIKSDLAIVTDVSEYVSWIEDKVRSFNNSR